MKTLLYLDCCIRRGESRTRKLAETFLAEIEARGHYEITRLCLMDENLSYFSEGFFEQRQRLLEAGNLSHPRFRYAHEFAAADRIVLAAPFWDLSIPALAKVYIENVSVDGITFGCNESGCYGLCKAEKLMFLTTRGGTYTGSSLEQGEPYIRAMCEFFGIDAYDSVVAEGLDLGIEPPEEILARAKAQAIEAARQF